MLLTGWFVQKAIMMKLVKDRCKLARLLASLLEIGSTKLILCLNRSLNGQFMDMKLRLVY
jgi:hypothetical protein